MRRWAERLALALLATASACGGGSNYPRYGPVPVREPAPLPRPAPPAPPPEVTEARPPSAESAPPPVRVGVVLDVPGGTVSSPSGLTLETESGDNLDELQQGESVAFATDADGSLSLTVVDAAGNVHGAVRHGIAPPVVVRAADGGVVQVRNLTYRGAIVVQRAGRRGLTFVNRLDLESYLLGVVPREIGDVDPSMYEAVKAQAVAARTYAVQYLGRREELGFDVYATTQDQVYGGVAAERELVTRAVRETSGEILTWGGAPITAYYHSTCAGRTAAIDEVWNVAPVPYLVSVDDTDPRTGEAYDRFASRFSWTERWTGAQLIAILNRTLADSLGSRRIHRLDDLEVLSRTTSGRVRALRIDTDAGSFTVGRDRVRWILTPARGGILNSSKFDLRVERAGGEVSAVTANGGGWGHGIGMCQVGAMGRARAGQDYRTILAAYYRGAQLRSLY